MSFLGRGPGNVPAGGVNIEKIELAVTDARYAEGDLNKGESVCIDRCVAKFTEVQKKVGEKLQNRGAANAGAAASSFGSL
ncbi:hypothetical protein C0991_008747 [Blastosporella zonata]|nr:hypothetical protein C0991_008747 [Blastosporella zonata]